MKIALKYGLLITAAIAAWTITVHLLIRDPNSRIHSLGTMLFFNLIQFAGIYFGIRAKEREIQGKLAFKDAVKTGVSISYVFAVAASLFFVCVLLIAGTGFMKGEPGAQALPQWLLLIQAFTGLFLGSMLFGLAYSTLISFAIARRKVEAT